jgi:Rha family phage regulatory protein
LNQLVFVENNQAVTTSLIVAEVFEKNHADVLRDIRKMECSEEFRLSNFAESSYLNLQNKEMPMYHMNKKGFTLLAMGYTGKEAMKFKEAYIDQFERMENELKGPRILTDREQLMASMQLTIEAAQEIAVMKEDVLEVKGEMKEVRTMVEHQITLDHGEQRRIQKGIALKVYELESGQELRAKLFREIHRELKDRFAVASYKDIKRKDMQSALRYIEAYVPRKSS